MEIAFNLITLLGGLGFFLYGMSLMGSGLKATAGGKLESILERLSSTPLKGVLLGTFVTAIIQSSSATTVMVVGFVNSGIMQLRQAIGIVMGANIGTTITAWILSLAGIESTSFWVRLFKPTSFAPIIVFVGACIIMFAKSDKKRSVGSILMGFGALMYGMSMMSAAADPLTEMKGFGELLLLFSNPFFGLLAGMLMTAVIQSSSATIGILQALAIVTPVPYATAIPIILGMDIGACVPVLLSSIGANKNGKRTALVYLYYNLIGSIIFLILFYSVNAMVDFVFLDQSATAVGIAIFNSIFKLCVTVVLLPLVGRLEKLVKLTVPDGKTAEHHGSLSEVLDDRFLSSPSYALKQCKNVVDSMADIALNNVIMALDSLISYDNEKANEIIINEGTTDEYEDKLGTYLVKLSSLSLSESESRNVSKLLHSIGDFERIADHSLNLLNTAKEIYEKKTVFSADADREIATTSKAIEEILTNAVEAFKNEDLATASRVEPLEQVIDLLCAELKNRHIDRLQKGVCTIETGFMFSDILNNFERISDHCSNIAVCVIRLKDRVYDTHEYLNHIKAANEGDFHDMFDSYTEKYLETL